MIDWVFDDEDQARAMVKRLLDADGLGRWREMDHRKMSPPLPLSALTDEEQRGERGWRHLRFSYVSDEPSESLEPDEL